MPTIAAPTPVTAVPTPATAPSDFSPFRDSGQPKLAP
jgi:hypothetical protein